MRMECDPTAARRLPVTAWLLAAAPAPSPWYLQLLGGAIMAIFLFYLLRLLYYLALSLVPRRYRLPASIRLRWSGNPEHFRPEPWHWALATALVFSVRNGDAWDRLRLDEPVEEARESLRQSWGIQDRPSLMQQLHGLLEGGHRAYLQPMVLHIASLSPAEYAAAYAEASRQPDDGERRERLSRLK